MPLKQMTEAEYGEWINTLAAERRLRFRLTSGFDSCDVPGPFDCTRPPLCNDACGNIWVETKVVNELGEVTGSVCSTMHENMAYVYIFPCP